MMPKRWLMCLIGVLCCTPSLASDEAFMREGIVQEEFIFDEAPFAACHASTIAESTAGLVAAWFGGSGESHPDVGIWVSRHIEGKWTPPVEVANGVQSAKKRFPCWNPVLFQPKVGALMLFFKVGPNPSKWWGEICTSDDSGKTWSKRRKLGEQLIGPVKNKPVQLADGSILCGSSTEQDGWLVHFERTPDLGHSWQRIGPIDDATKFNAIQPTILTYGGGRMQILCRTRENVIAQSWSQDNGATWSRLSATMLPNPDSGIDAVTLKDGRQLLVYNHTVRRGPSPRGREMLNVAVSEDGVHWKAVLLLENQKGEHSYPAVIQTSDGKVHITYTYHRKRIKHVVVEPSQLKPRSFHGSRWPGLAATR